MVATCHYKRAAAWLPCDAFARADVSSPRSMHTLKGRPRSARGMSWWRAEITEWLICIARQFKLHVVKHEVSF